VSCSRRRKSECLEGLILSRKAQQMALCSSLGQAALVAPQRPAPAGFVSNICQGAMRNKGH